MDPVRNEQDVDRLRRQFSAFCVLIGWSRTGLLHALGDGQARTAKELPGDPRAIALTAPILAHLGVLIRYTRRDGEEAWALSHTARAMERSGSLTLDAWELLQGLSKIDELLTTGGPLNSTDIGIKIEDEAGSRAFTQTLYRRSESSAEETARILAARVGRGRALDLGGGHGRYGHELAARGFEVTLFDRPLICGFARERYKDTLKYMQGDFHTDPLGGPWDLVLVSNIVHGLGLVPLAALLQRIRTCLAPRGLLALKDMFLSSSRVTPEIPVLFNVMMLLYTEHGRSYAANEVEALLRGAGFSGLEHIDVGDQGFSLLLAS